MKFELKNLEIRFQKRQVSFLRHKSWETAFLLL